MEVGFCADFKIVIPAFAGVTLTFICEHNANIILECESRQVIIVVSGFEGDDQCKFKHT